MARRKENRPKSCHKTISQRKATKNRWIKEETLREVEVRRKVKSKGNSTQVQEAIYKEQNSKIRRMMRKDKEEIVEDQCKKIEENAMTNTTRELSNGVRSCVLLSQTPILWFGNYKNQE